MPDFTISDSHSVIGSFASRPAPKLVFGPGALRELAACVREVGGTSVFLVTDPGLARAGYVERARALLVAGSRQPQSVQEAYARSGEQLLILRESDVLAVIS